MRQTRVQYPGATLGGQAGHYPTPAFKGIDKLGCGPWKHSLNVHTTAQLQNAFSQSIQHHGWQWDSDIFFLVPWFATKLQSKMSPCTHGATWLGTPPFARKLMCMAQCWEQNHTGVRKYPTVVMYKCVLPQRSMVNKSFYRIFVL